MKTFNRILCLFIIAVIIGFTTPADATQRLKYTGIARSTGGAVLGSATVTIYLAGTTTAANVYEASSGGDSVTSVISDSNGRWTFYADVADYAFTQEYKVVVTKDGYSTITLDNIFNLSLPTNAVGVLTNDGSGNYTWSASSFSESGDYSPTGTWDWSGATITSLNASTATALAANPTDCSANQFANAIAESGNLTCAALTDADIPDTITASNYLPLAGGTMTGDVLMSTLKKIKMYESTNTYYVGFLASDSLSASYDLIPPASSPTGILRADAGVMSASDTLSGVTVNGGTASTVAVWDGSQNLTSLTSQNMVTTGQIDGRVKVVVATDTVTIDASAGNQAVYYINGADSARTFNLPAAVAGLAYCFANALYAKALTVDPAAGDQIILAGAAADAGEYVESTSAAATDKICVLAIDTTYWLVTASTGTWAQDTP